MQTECRGSIFFIHPISQLTISIGQSLRPDGLGVISHDFAPKALDFALLLKRLRDSWLMPEEWKANFLGEKELKRRYFGKK